MAMWVNILIIYIFSILQTCPSNNLKNDKKHSLSLCFEERESGSINEERRNKNEKASQK